MLTFAKLSKDQITQTDWSALAITAMLPSNLSLQPDADEIVFAATLDGQIIALAALDGKLPNLLPTGGMLCGLFVLPEYRRQGVGRMLVGLAAGAVMEMGAYFLRAKSPDTDEAAAFSQKIGFRPEPASNDTLVLLDLTDTKGLRQH